MSTAITKREPLDALEAYFEIGRIARPIDAVADTLDTNRHRHTEIAGDLAYLAARGLKDLIALQDNRKIGPSELEDSLTGVSSMLAAFSALALVLANYDTLTNDSLAPVMERREYESALIGLTSSFAWRFRDDHDAVDAWTAACGAALEVAS